MDDPIEKRNDFIRFLVDAVKQGNNLLWKGFINIDKDKPSELHSWFMNNGYDVPSKDCQAILKTREFYKGKTIPLADSDCTALASY
jgi:predicted deacetylase